MIMFKRLIVLNSKNIFIFLIKEKIAGGTMILILGMAFLNGFSATFQIGPEKIKQEFIFDLQQATGISGYFPLAYTGKGVDHMNINLVNLKLTGLKVGDEVGVFDGIYCIGAALIEQKHMQDNSISIITSANDTIESNPNGYIEGHKISMKAYHSEIVYLLNYQTVNNSKDVFIKWESMFAFIDFPVSSEHVLPETQTGTILYPNPFSQSIRMEINLPQAQHLTVAIFDLNGKLIRTLFEGKSEEQTLLIWNGKNNTGQNVSSGIYLCRANQVISKIIYKFSSNSN